MTTETQIEIKAGHIAKTITVIERDNGAKYVTAAGATVTHLSAVYDDELARGRFNSSNAMCGARRGVIKRGTAGVAAVTCKKCLAYVANW